MNTFVFTADLKLGELETKDNYLRRDVVEVRLRTTGLAHLNLELTNVELLFLPLSTVSHTQPIDFNTIKNFLQFHAGTVSFVTSHSY